MLKVLFPWKHNNTKKVLLAMEQVEDKEVPEVTEEPPENLPLLPCHVCHRTFLPQPLKKHIRICEQMLHKKRKPFDSLKQRVEGTDLAPFFQKSYLKKNNPVMSSKKEAGDVYGNNKPSKWKEKHLELMNTIRTAKGVSPDMNSHSSSTTATTPNRKATHLVVSQSSVNERCPSCDRAFGPKAFDRHVEWCREHKSRVHKSPADVQQAKERLEARIKYRVPPLKQPKRLTVREKYSPITQTNHLLHRAGTIVAGKSSTSIGSSSTASMTINRKKHANAIEKESGQANKELDSRSRFDKSIGDCGEVKELVKGDSTMGKSFHTKRTIPTKKINNTTVNSGLQDITVSSLSIGNDKKLVTWKDTVDLPQSSSEVIAMTTNRLPVQSRMDVKEKKSKFGTSGKPQQVVKSVTDEILREKLLTFYQKKKVDRRKLSEAESADTDVTIEKFNTTPKRRIPLLLRRKSRIEIPRSSTSDITVISSDLESDRESSRLELIGVVNEELETVVESDGISISSVQEPENIASRTSDRSDGTSEVPNMKQDMEGSNIIRAKLWNNLGQRNNVDVIDKFMIKHEQICDEPSQNNSGLSKENYTKYVISQKVDGLTRMLTKEEMENVDAKDTEPHKSDVAKNVNRESLNEVDIGISSAIANENISESVNNSELLETMRLHRLKAAKKRQELIIMEREVYKPPETEKYPPRDVKINSQESLFLEVEGPAEVMPYEDDSFDQRINSKTKNSKEIIEDHNHNIASDETVLMRELQEIHNAASAETVLVRDLQDSSVCGSARCNSSKKITFRITRQTKISKRRKKLKKCRMCIKCFHRNIKSLRSLGLWGYLHYQECPDSSDGYNSTEENIEDTFTYGSPQVCEELHEHDIDLEKTCEGIKKKHTAISISIHKSRSANCIASDTFQGASKTTLGSSTKLKNSDEMSCKHGNISSRSLPASRSLPNLASKIDIFGLPTEEWIKGNGKQSPENKLDLEDSFESVVPRKKRKISAGIPNSTNTEKEVEDLRTNISMIKTRKMLRDEPPSILDYGKTRLGRGRESTANILYMNEVFSTFITPERSEFEYEVENSGGIDEIADEVMSNWDTVEEEFPKDLGTLERCESPMKANTLTGGNPAGADITESRFSNSVSVEDTLSDDDQNNSIEKLKNSHACTAMNIRKNQEEIISKNRNDEILEDDVARNIRNIHFLELSRVCTERESDSVQTTKSEDSARRSISSKSQSSRKKKSEVIDSNNVDKIPCRLPRIPQLKRHNKQKLSRESNVNLPLISGTHFVQVKSTDAVHNTVSDKTIQIPSQVANRETASVCQQTSLQTMENSTSSVSSINVETSVSNLQQNNGGSSVTLPSTPLYDPFESAQRQFMELLENDDNVSIKSSPVTPNIHDYIYKQQNLRPHTTTNATPKQKITNSTNKSKKPKVDKVGSDPKRTSVIDPPYNFQDKINSLDEEFELIESLVNNNLINEESDKSNRFFLNLESLRYVGDETSTSTRRKYSDDMSFIDPDLINEHDNLSIPENLNSDEYSPTSTTNSEITVQNFKPFSDSLENIDTIPDPSSLSKLNTKISNKIILPSIKIDNIRPAPDGSSAEVETKENRLNLKTPTMLGQLPRSKSNFKIGSSGDRDKKKKKLTSTNNLSKPPNLHKKEDVKNYFNVQKDQQKQNHLKQETVGLGELKAEELFSVDDEMYEEYKKYEEMYLKEKDGKSSSKKHKKKTADFGIAIEDKGSKICADSAYGSLNRKQPINEPEEPLLSTELGTGETSTSSPGGRMSKFCHECGNRYPVSAAKFCVECGVKRLVL